MAKLKAQKNLLLQNLKDQIETKLKSSNRAKLKKINYDNSKTNCDGNKNDRSDRSSYNDIF